MNQIESKSKRKSLDDEISKIGINRDDFYQYCEQFAGNKAPYIYRRADVWRYSKHPISYLQIAEHLAETRYYGTSSGDYTDYIVVDVDRHSDDEKDFHKRLETVIEAFPSATLIQSSSSGGIHCYVFLDGQEPLKKVSNLTANRLTRHGLKIQKGQVEIFPAEKRCIRLPFGKDSFVLDNWNLERITFTKQEDIRYVMNQSDRCSIDEIFSTDDLSCTSLSSYAPNTTFLIKYSVDTPHKHSIFEGKCERYLEEGLKEFGTRYEITSSLIFYCLNRLNLDEDKTYDLIAKWLHEKHNGMSKEWNESPENVLRILRSQITSYARKASHKHGLTREEVEPILNKQFTYEEQKFLFSLFRFLKSFSDDDGSIYISRKAFCKMRGAGERHYIERRDLALREGFITKTKDFERGKGSLKGKPNQYKHLMTFDRTRQEFFHIDGVLLSLYDNAELVNRYGKITANQILLEKVKRIGEKV